MAVGLEQVPRDPPRQRALVTGVTGQDGAYLARLLLNRGYEVYGTCRPQSSGLPWRLERLGIVDEVKVIPMDLTDDDSVEMAICESNPHEIYNLAAQSHVGLSYSLPQITTDINALGPVRLLKRIRHTGTKFYQAGTSEMFGHSPPPQNEETPFKPVSPYGRAKLYAHQAVEEEREAFGTFAVNGILFNHESPLRGPNFVTQKICRHLKEGKKTIRLGDVSPKRDWGHAENYVHGMFAMMQNATPKDYVLATGESRTVMDFLHAAEEVCGRTIEVEIDNSLIRAQEIPELRGDAFRAAEELGWFPTIPFERLVEEMLE